MKESSEATTKFAKVICIELGEEEVARLLEVKVSALRRYKSVGLPVSSVYVLKLKRPNLNAWHFLPKGFLKDVPSEASAL